MPPSFFKYLASSLSLFRYDSSHYSEKRGLRTFELVISLTIMVTAFIYAIMYMKAMASTSLWNDELYTIQNFSSQGILKTLTDYHVPNNHIFFNFINAIIPNSDSFFPLRARMWSFLAMIGLAVIGIRFFFSQRLFLEGSLFFFGIFANPALLDLGLQARGYGLVYFFASATAIVLSRYIKSKHNLNLFFIGLLSFLGTWTVPTYGFFAAPLFIILFIYSRSTKVFIAGILTACFIILAYLPVIDDLLDHALHFEDSWGNQYATIESVFKTLQQYLLFDTPHWLIFLFWSGLASLSILLWSNTREYNILGLLSLGCILFFTVCLYVKTPLIRTTSFIIPVIVFIVAQVVGIIYRRNGFLSLRLIILILSAIILTSTGYSRIRYFDFVPLESWMRVGKIIERAFPHKTSVYCNLCPNYLRPYLSKSRSLDRDFNLEEFKKGYQVVVDSKIFNISENKFTLIPPEERFRPGSLTQESACIKVPQRRGAYQAIWFMPISNTSFVQDIEINGERLKNKKPYDQNFKTRWSTGKSQCHLNGPVKVKFLLDPDFKYHSLIITCQHRDVPLNFKAYAQRSNRKQKLSLNNIMKTSDHLIISLEGINKGTHAVSLIVRPASTDRYFSINEVWAYPEKGGK